jgi:hypothetical protein
MSDVISVLQNDLQKRKTDFLERLTNSGNNELANQYNNLITIEATIEIYRNENGHQASRRKSATKSVSATQSKPRSPRNANKGDFVLVDAASEIVREFNGKEFLFSEYFDLLKTKYPNKIDESKRGSASATLSNLITRGKLKNTGKAPDGKSSLFQATVAL